MFVGRQELETVKVELESLKDDTILLNERFLTHTKQEEETARRATLKMDEIIDLIKDSHNKIDSTADKVHLDLTERLSREYATVAIIDEKLVNMKNCCRAEFINSDTATLKHEELAKDINTAKDIALDKVVSLRRECYIVISIITTLAALYVGYFKG